MLPNLNLVMRFTMARQAGRLSRGLCRLSLQRLQPHSLARFPATLLARTVDLPLGMQFVHPSLQRCTPPHATLTESS
jgi:hypothetical protein